MPSVSSPLSLSLSISLSSSHRLTLTHTRSRIILGLAVTTLLFLFGPLLGWAIASPLWYMYDIDGYREDGNIRKLLSVVINSLVLAAVVGGLICCVLVYQLRYFKVTSIVSPAS